MIAGLIATLILTATAGAAAVSTRMARDPDVAGQQARPEAQATSPHPDDTPHAGTDVQALVEGLRSDKGEVLACLTRHPDAFPDCRHDPGARTLRVKAREPLVIDFGDVAPGDYAISLVHDENGNGKLDTMLMIPREGFGFSRDAPVHMGPPRFASAAFEARGPRIRLAIRMRYIL